MRAYSAYDYFQEGDRVRLQPDHRLAVALSTEITYVVDRKRDTWTRTLIYLKGIKSGYNAGRFYLVDLRDRKIENYPQQDYAGLFMSRTVKPKKFPRRRNNMNTGTKVIMPKPKREPKHKKDPTYLDYNYNVEDNNGHA